MKEITTLMNNKWLSLKIVKDESKNVFGYVFSHETRCNGHIISILPFRKNNGKLEFLLRKELTPCWDLNRLVVSSITGGLKGIDTDYTAIQELQEEAGYFVEKEDLIFLGKCYGVKSSDTVYHLYSVDLTDKIQQEPTTDDVGEQMSYCFWSDNVLEAEDPFVYVAMTKLFDREFCFRDDLKNKVAEQ